MYRIIVKRESYFEHELRIVKQHNSNILLNGCVSFLFPSLELFSDAINSESTTEYDSIFRHGIMFNYL